MKKWVWGKKPSKGTNVTITVDEEPGQFIVSITY